MTIALLHPLSSPVIAGYIRKLVGSCFYGKNVEVAINMLRNDCSDSVPGVYGNPSEIERLQVSAIRLSEGELDKLQRAIRLANIDYRDLLTKAGFASDPEAHIHWRPDW